MLGKALKQIRKHSLNLSEPIAPKVVTEIPGPQSLTLLNEFEGVSQDYRTVRFFADYEKSAGNYIADADGNQILDCYGQSSSLALGYNHPDMINATANTQTMINQRPAMGISPPADIVWKTNQALMQNAPVGLTELFNSCGCGSAANENALKASFLKYRSKKYGKDFDANEIQTAMNNQAPGAPKIGALSFSNGFHGRLMGCLSCGNSKPIAKQDFPTFDWPIIDFPQLKYPLERYPENQKLEEQALDKVERAVKDQSKPVAAIITEAMQYDGGNYYASSQFYQGLRKIADDNKITLIVDEVNSGFGASGKMWLHQYYKIVPDILTFGKKAQVAGYFAKPEYRPDFPSMIFGTWMGDPLRLELTLAVNQVIKRDNVLENVAETGKYILEGIDQLAQKYGQISNQRGFGLLLAWDLKDKQTAWKFVKSMLQKGVQVGLTQDKVIRITPSLIFQKKHADVLLGAVEDTLKEMK